MFVMPESVIGSTVESFRKDFSSFMKDESQSTGHIVFDFSKIQDIDTAGLQMLLSVFKTLEKENRAFSVEKASPFVKHVFMLAGVSDIIREDNKTESEDNENNLTKEV